jgi:ABC-type uncharacterized transport system involved in gliding motility auxiliary subunit
MKQSSFITGLAVLIVLIVGNYFVSRHFIRADLTENQAYTLADATKHVLRDLDDIVTMRVYFSNGLPPQLTPLKRGVDDLLAEYQQYGGDNFQVEYIDPQADPQTERELMVMGIQPMQVNVVEKDKQEVARIFLGLVMFHEDKKQVVPINPHEPTRHIEEWLTGAIVKLTRDTIPTIGWWPAKDRPQGSGYNLVKQLLQERYTITDVDDVKPTLNVKKLDGLVIISPKELSETQLIAIDQYLGNGGRVVVFTDTIQLAANFSGVKRAHGLGPLLKPYGVTIPVSLVADVVSEYASFRSGHFSYSVPYPLWPAVRGDGLNAEDPVVGKLESLTLPWVAPIELDATMPQGLTVSVLAKSSDMSHKTPGEPPFALDPQSAGLLLPKSQTTPKNLIVKLSGTFPEAFPGKGTDRNGADGQLILVGSAAFLEDNFAGKRQFREGVTFFDNVVDHLAIGDALLGIRSRPVTSRPIAQLSPAQKMGVRYANMLGVPFLIILGGFGGLLIRRRRWRAIQSSYRKD